MHQEGASRALQMAFTDLLAQYYTLMHAAYRPQSGRAHACRHKFVHSACSMQASAYAHSMLHEGNSLCT